MGSLAALGVGAGPAAVGPFSPSDIAGLQGWWDADAIVGLNDGDAVATWEDSHTSNHDLAQATAGQRPTYQTNEINGLPVVRFVAADDNLTSGAFTLNQPLTYFAVVKMTDSGGFVYLCDGNAADSLIIYNANDGAKFKGYAGSVGPSLTVDTTNFHVIAFKFDNASSAAYLDGGSAVTGTTGAGNPGGLTLGARASASSGFTGDIAEFLVYDSALSDVNRAAVEAFLATKYGL